MRYRLKLVKKEKDKYDPDAYLQKLKTHEDRKVAILKTKQYIEEHYAQNQLSFDYLLDRYYDCKYCNEQFSVVITTCVLGIATGVASAFIIDLSGILPSGKATDIGWWIGVILAIVAGVMIAFGIAWTIYVFSKKRINILFHGDYNNLLSAYEMKLIERKLEAEHDFKIDEK